MLEDCSAVFSTISLFFAFLSPPNKLCALGPHGGRIISRARGSLLLIAYIHKMKVMAVLLLNNVFVHTWF